MIKNPQTLVQAINNLKLAKHNLDLGDNESDQGYSRSIDKLIKDLTEDFQKAKNYADRIEAYRAGWINAARWVNREDLISDIGSPEYIKDRNNFLKNETQS